jgi:Salt stress response/antifungal
MTLSFSILVLSPLLILTQFNCYSNAKLLNSNCSKTDTYAIGDTIESNLFKLFSSLSTDALINSGFSNRSFGNSPDKVYGLVMCYNDYSTQDCVNCIRNITSSTTQPCSMSATATVLYDPCLLSYSSKDFFSVADHYMPYCLYSGANSLDEKTQKSLIDVLANLSASTPYKSEMFSTKVVSGADMSAFMQCTRDLSPEECQKCISYAMNYFNWCSINGTALGMRIMTRNCYIRYESYVLNISSFPQSLIPPSPPPSSPLSPPPPSSISPASGIMESPH